MNTETKSTNPLDAKMTPAQVARRKFKSSLPRKPQNSPLTAMVALGTTLTLLDRFRAAVAEANLDPATVAAALAYSWPESRPDSFPSPILVPEPPKPGESSRLGNFCDEVMNHEGGPLFLGVVFVQTDPDADSSEYRTVSFAAPFMGGPDAEYRLGLAQKELELAILKRRSSD